MTVRLRAGSNVRGVLLLDPSLSPLDIISVASSQAAFLAVCDATGPSGFFHLTLNDECATWNGVEVRFSLRWSPADSEDVKRSAYQVREWRAPCVVLPDMLPRIIAIDEPLHDERHDRLARILFEAPLPEQLGLASIAVSDAQAGSDAALLQAIIFPTARAQRNPVGALTLDVVLAHDVRVSAAEATQALEYGTNLLRFLGSELGQPAAVHAALCLTDTPSPPLYPAIGAYAFVRPEDAGARRKNVGKPQSILRMLAQCWIGGGVRLSGENANELTLAIGGALGLRWMQRMRMTTALANAIATQEAALLERPVSEYRLMHRAFALQLPLYRALEDPDGRAMLQRFIAEHWGAHVPQGVFINTLREGGISVPGVFM